MEKSTKGWKDKRVQGRRLSSGPGRARGQGAWVGGPGPACGLAPPPPPAVPHGARLPYLPLPEHS